MILTKLADISKPIEDTWTNLNYRNLECKNKLNSIIRNKKLIHNFDDDIDNIILNILNYYDNINSFVIFGKKKDDAYKYYTTNFSDDYILYGIKHMTLKYSLIHKIMYQLLFPRFVIKTKNDLYDYISQKYKFLSNFQNDMIDITVLIMCKKDLHKKYPTNDIIDDNYIIYIPNTKEEIWHCATVFFSNSTLMFLEKQNFDFFLTKDMEPSKKMFLKYRKWLNNNISEVYQPQFMLFSSIVLYLLGNRAMNDLDLYIHTIPEDLQEKLNEFNTDSSFKFIEFKIKNTDNWPKHWNTWLDIWAQKCGAKYFEEILGNPKYHFYFLGIKIISLECDIVRRLERARPRAVADLIALRKRYSMHINIPSVPKTSIQYIKLEEKSSIEISELIQKGGVLNEENREISLTHETDVSKFISTIIYALHTRYKMVFSINEVKRELGMDFEDNQPKDKPIKINIKKKVIVKK